MLEKKNTKNIKSKKTVRKKPEEKKSYTNKQLSVQIEKLTDKVDSYIERQEIEQEIIDRKNIDNHSPFLFRLYEFFQDSIEILLNKLTKNRVEKVVSYFSIFFMILLTFIPVLLLFLCAEAVSEYLLREHNIYYAKYIVYLVLFSIISTGVLLSAISFKRSLSVILIGYLIQTIDMVLLFGILYIFTGIYYTDDPGQVINYLNGTKQTVYDCIYFSLTMWTNLGFGDIMPSRDSKILVAVESILGYLHLGILLMGLSMIFNKDRGNQ